MSSLVAAAVLVAAACALSLVAAAPRARPALRSVAIVVLGDVGRSPRTMYHAESFAKLGFDTFLIGYHGSAPVPSLTVLPHVHLLYLPDPPRLLRTLPFLLAAPLKVAHQVLAVLAALLMRTQHPPEFILVQNPPSIPTLALVWLAARIRGSKVIIDWHNLGYSILALRLGTRHPLVAVARRFEAWFGRAAYAHLFVTQAMHDHLVPEWRLQGHTAVLHDRPPRHFHRAAPSETHELFLRLAPDLAPLASFLPPSTAPFSTPLTHAPHPPAPAGAYAAYSPAPRPDRPALLVSSTSWTADEDFGLLLAALDVYDAAARAPAAALPRLLVLLTGKGPLRAHYMAAAARRHEAWTHVRCASLWLAPADYPLLLGSADLGVSLHTSSSGLDLPMKVVDMFGCALPVCALGFACLPELVRDGRNGRVFADAAQLASQLQELLAGFPTAPALAALRVSLLRESAPPAATAASAVRADAELAWGSWDDNWARVVRPLVLRDVAMDDGWR